jgi:hypothetical protein
VLLLGVNLIGLPASLHPERNAFGPVTLGEWWEVHRSIGSWIRERTPADAVILCNEAPVLSVLSGRRAYTYRHARDVRLLERYRPDYVVIYPAAPPFLREQVRRTAVERLAIPVGTGSVPIYRLADGSANRGASQRSSR